MNKPRGTKPPYGYKWNNGELVRVPEEITIYREAIDLYLIHRRKGTVARELNKKGYRTRMGLPFNFTSINRMLKHPVAKGEYSYSQTEKKTLKKVPITLSVPKVVNEETWNQVQEIMADPQTKKSKQDAFVGKVYCCDQSMEILSKSTNYTCYKCKHEIPIDDIHAIFEHAIRDIPFPERKILEDLSKNHVSVSSVKTKIAQLNRDKDKLFELYSSEAVDIDSFKQRHEKLKTHIAELTENMKSLENSAKEEHATLGVYWSTLDRSNKQLLADCLIDRIDLNRNVASLSLYPLFNFAQFGNVSA